MLSKITKISGLMLLLAVIGVGCGNNNGGGGGGFFFPLNPYVDLAVGDGNGTSQVAVYFDVLNDQDSNFSWDPTPDLVLNNANSQIDYPRSVVLSGDDLYVGNIGSGEITIFRDYRTLTDNAAPDVVLTGMSALGRPKEMRVAGDTLVVCDDNNDQILIFYSASTIIADVAPDVTLDNTGSNISNPDGIAVASGDLYVANYNNDDVAIFRTISTLSDGDSPDAVLGAATSFMNLSGGTRGALVDSNILYVPTANGPVFIFNGASTLANDALPDAVLQAPSDTGDETLDLAVLDTNLFAGVRIPTTSTDPGLVGFTPAATLTDDQVASFVLRDTAGATIVSTHELTVAGNALFANVLPETDDTYATGSVLIYLDANNLTAGNVDADLELSSSGVVTPISVSAIDKTTGF